MNYTTFTINTYEQSPPFKEALEKAKELFSEEMYPPVYCEVALQETEVVWKNNREYLVYNHTFRASCK